jgi:hypothetical protein
MSKFEMKLYNWVDGVLDFEKRMFHDLEEAIEFAGEAICHSVKIFSGEGLVIHELTKQDGDQSTYA